MTRIRTAILISGRGSNMQAVLDAAQHDDYAVDPVLVLSNRPDAAGLKIAQSYEVATAIVDHKAFGKDRQAFERAMQLELQSKRVEMIILAGFMRILTPWFVGLWTKRMINIHPSLLPKYPGLDTHQRAIDAKDPEAGCSVHWVTEGVDEGDVIAQARVQIRPNDTAASLAARVLPAEHALYPKAANIAARMILRRQDLPDAP